MKISKWDPFREMESVLERYRPAPEGKLTSSEGMSQSDWYPCVDVSESAGAFHIHAELPGVKKVDIKVSVHDGVLTLSGERESKYENKDKKVHRIERSYGSFSRSFSLPGYVSCEAVEAIFQDGVLDINIPKEEVKKPKQVEVTIN
jgi:HSP20 family protein